MLEVSLSEYQSEWPAQFRQAAAELSAALNPAFVHIEHIGSTSVVGLCAKPVIDMMLGVASLSDVISRISVIEALGYVYRSEYEGEFPERRYFVRPARTMPKVHLHTVVYAGAFWTRQLSFRDALRADPELAVQYASLKQQLATTYAKDKAAYTEAKTPFIERVLALQRRTLG